MKSIQKAVLLTSILLLAANSYAGRWITRDPIEFMERDPKPAVVAPQLKLSLYQQQANLYTFVGNNPVNSIDPLGLWQVTIGAGEFWGGMVTFGDNGGTGNWFQKLYNGQWNLGAYGPFGSGLAFNIDTKDSGKRCPTDKRTQFGIKGEGEFGMGAHTEGGLVYINKWGCKFLGCGI